MPMNYWIIGNGLLQTVLILFVVGELGPSVRATLIATVMLIELGGRGHGEKELQVSGAV
jgi:hypothetical protein